MSRNLTKADYIDKIEAFDTQLIWDIDKPLYYSCLGSDGQGGYYWYDRGLKALKGKQLKELVALLEKQEDYR